MLSQKVAAPRSLHDPGPVASSRGRVLVVSESGAAADVAVRALRGEHFEVVEVASVKVALEAARVSGPDAVVLDVSLTEIEAFDICRRLKGAAATPLPVLYLSSRTSREARARALDAGIDGYLTRPFAPSDLRAAVGALVRVKRQEEMRHVGEANGGVLPGILDALLDNIALLGFDGEILAVNRAWTQFTLASGLDGAGTGVGANYLAVCDAATGNFASEAIAAALGIRKVLNGDLESFELDYPCFTPTMPRWFRLIVRRVAFTGPVAAIVSHIERTSEQLSSDAERAALVASAADRQRLDATLEALPVGVWIADPTGRITHSNAAASRLWGGEAPHAETVDGYAVYRARWPDTGIALEPEDWSLARTLRTSLPIADELVQLDRFDGKIGYVLVSSAPIFDGDGGLIGALVVNTDVTERHAAAKERERMVAALEFERARLATIFEEAPAFLAVLRGPDFIFERFNPAYRQLIGHREVIGKSLLDALPEIRGQGFVELLEEVRVTGVPFVGKRTPVLLARVPGAPLETRYLDMVYQRIVDSVDDYAIVAHGVDVTEQVLATEALRRTEQLLRDQFAKLPVPTYLWQLQGDDFVLLESNEAAVRSAPMHGAAAIGQLTRTLFPGMDDARKEMLRALRDNIVVRCTAEFEGSPGFGKRRVDLTIGPQQPDRVLAHAVDTTARIELEAQLRQAQKMDAVGRLAGGVAHDFNNLLTVIGAHSALLLESLQPENALREDAEAIQQAGIRAAGLTRQLLAFSRKQILKPTVLDLNVIVEDTRKLLARLLGEDIHIVTELAPQVVSVVADATQLSQVLMNLAVNARDAMPAGGTLTIRTRIVTVDASEHRGLMRSAAGEYALLEVSDTGIGMDATVQARLFEPFFTTKEPGQGTGLGLATVYGIVKQSAGYVLVESTPKQGTTFRVYLPTTTEVTSGMEQELLAAENAAVHGIETVLLVEDEKQVREIASRILRRHGYDVLLAASGAEALAISAAYASTIHLVISDAVMPGMTGAEVVQRLQALRPGLKALFMSGYTDDEILRRGIVSSTAAFIQKPFTLADFARAAREALDG
jgi:two-component system cell cycle sensor histidine kinase/response regulator CckA